MIDLSAAAVPGGGGKSLKNEYRWQLWMVLAFNSLFLYGVVQENTIRFDGFQAALRHFENLLPVGFALVITTVLNGLLSEGAKARLVFLRWNFALPGHRAFSLHACADPRIDLGALRVLCGGELPVDPAAQNRIWYRMYKTVQDEPAVRQVHRDFLLLRDYAGFSILLILFYGCTAFYAVHATRIAAYYTGLLALQYFFVRQAASNYGISFVKTVLAQKAADPEIV